MGIEVNLEGKIAFVTGASSGLGDRFARVLSNAGATVVLAARRMDRLKELRAEIEAEGREAHVVPLDVTDHASIRDAVAHAESEAGADRHPRQQLGRREHEASRRRHARRLRVRDAHEHRRRILRRAGGREADDRAGRATTRRAASR